MQRPRAAASQWKCELGRVRPQKCALPNRVRIAEIAAARKTGDEVGLLAFGLFGPLEFGGRRRPVPGSSVYGMLAAMRKRWQAPFPPGPIPRRARCSMRRVRKAVARWPRRWRQKAFGCCGKRFTASMPPHICRTPPSGRSGKIPSRPRCSSRPAAPGFSPNGCARPGCPRPGCWRFVSAPRPRMPFMGSLFPK